MIRANHVLAGGPFRPKALGTLAAAYVVVAGDESEAESLIAADPLVSSGAAAATVVPWDLVAVNLRVVPPELALGEVPRPDHARPTAQGLTPPVRRSGGASSRTRRASGAP